ncbi:hypothetical protein ACODT3_08310 [Streptomyces sp. 4.24]|uniref:hypothetical protein n=1 Tax=Streptomyces tritrimontium TaxID=3406573 RepID=UPI003BB71ED8
MTRGRGAGRTARPAREAGDGTARATGTPSSSPVAGRWLFTGTDGRLTAYACGRDGLLRWTEAQAPDSGWTGPEELEVPGWTGHAALAQSHEGYVHIVVARTAPDTDGEGGPEIAVATQHQSGRGLTWWTNLGTPGLPGGPQGDGLAVPPTLAVNQSDGSVHVIVSLRLGGILRRSRSLQGVWGAWKEMTPDPYEGRVTAYMPTDGRLELIALGPAGVDRWAGIAKGRFHLADHVATPVVAGTPAVCETGPRRVTYFWRYPGDGSLVAWRTGNQQGQSGLMGLGGAGGRGAPGVCRALVGGYDCTVLVQVGAEDQIELTAYVTENESYGAWWTPLGAGGLRAPQVAVDALGRIVVAGFDRDGALVLTRQDTTQQGLAFGPWHTAG